MAELLERQQREVACVQAYVDSAFLEDVQRLGHHDDIARGVARCPLCPHHSLDARSSSMQKKWKKYLQRHLKNLHRIKNARLKTTRPKKHLLCKTRQPRLIVVGGDTRADARVTAASN